MSGRSSGPALPPVPPNAARDSSRKHRRGSRDSVLPSAYKSHLNSLFKEIETEFTHLYLENVRLKEQIEMLEKGNPDRDKEDDADGFDINVIKSFTKKNFPKTRQSLRHRRVKLFPALKLPRCHVISFASIRGTGTESGTCACPTLTRRWSGRRQLIGRRRCGARTPASVC